MASAVERRQTSFRQEENAITEDIDGTMKQSNQRPEEDVPLSDPMSWYPRVSPPRANKKDFFQADRFEQIDDWARNAAPGLIKSFRELVTYLTSGLTSDLARVRSIFSWMGAQQLAMGHAEAYSEQPSPSSPEFIMKEAAQGKREAFSVLFAHLCRKAGVACMTVRGLVKAAAYVPGNRATCGNSMWTIVHVKEGGWRFVHPLWAFRFVQNYSLDDRWTEVEDAGYAKRQKQIKDHGEVKGHVDEFWFLTDPEDFNFLCHADEKEAGMGKQLLPEPWSTQLFLGLPGLKIDFFKSRWKLLSPNSAVVETNNGKCSIDFQHPEQSKAELTYKLFFDESSSTFGQLPVTLQSEVFVTRLKAGKGILSLVTRLPVVGLYKLLVTGVLDNGPPSLLGQFCLLCSSLDSQPRPFPSNPENGFGFDEASLAAGLSHPSQTDGVQLVKKGQSLDFSFEVDEHRELVPQLKHGFKRPEELACHVTLRRNRNHVSIGVHLPSEDADPEYSLEIYVGGARNSGGSELARQNSAPGLKGERSSPSGRAPREKKGEVDSKTAREDPRRNGNAGRNGAKPDLPSQQNDAGHDFYRRNTANGEGRQLFSGPSTRNNGRAASTGSDEEDAISNPYKGGNSCLVPASTGSDEEDDISNPYKGGNSYLVPASQARGGEVGLLANALNYLLTADKQLHDESNSDTKELHKDLQEALESGDEATIRYNLVRFLAAGLDNPVAISKVKAKERTWDETRGRLMKVAEESNSLGRVNRVIGDFKANKMEDRGELQPALDRLMSLSEQVVKSALSSRSIPELDTALRRVRSSHVAKRARSSSWFREAQTIRTNSAVRGLCEEAAGRLGTTSVLGLGMEDRPVNRQLQRTLAATLALLGEDPESLKNSRTVKNRVRETSAGKSQLLERIKNFSVEQTTKNHVIRAERELKGCNVKELEKDSGVAARRLHDWCQSVVKELSFHIWNEDEE